MNNIVKFQEKEIELVNIDGAPFMTCRQIDDALGMATRNGTATLYSRHADEFTPEMTRIVKHGRTRVRVFNREGAWLIGIFARTPIAATFRKWVLVALGEHVDGTERAELSAEDKKAIGGIVKKCAAKAVKDEIANVRPAPFKVATAYEQYAFEDTIKRLVRETLIDFFAPEDNAPHPSGMAFGNWAASAVHAVGAMRSEYAALNERVKQAKALLAAK